MTDEAILFEDERSVHLNDFQVSFEDEIDSSMTEAYGEVHWKEIKKALCRPPSVTSVRVNTMLWTVEEAMPVLQEALDEFNGRLEATGRPPILVRRDETVDDLLLIPSAPGASTSPISWNRNWKHVIVDRFCGEAALRGSDIFARGVMCASSLNEGDSVNVWVDIGHKTTRGLAIGRHEGTRVFIGHGLAVMGRSKLFSSDRGVAVKMSERVCPDAPPMNGILPGKVYVQNIPSCVVAHVVDPQPGDVVFDMCSAPGGKTSHLATLMKNIGIVIAADRIKKKVEALKEMVVSTGLSSIKPLHINSSKSILSNDDQKRLLTEMGVDGNAVSVKELIMHQTERGERIKGFFPGTFDRILLDPSCSALGLRPRLLHSCTSRALGTIRTSQRNLFQAAVKLLRPGGY